MVTLLQYCHQHTCSAVSSNVLLLEKALNGKLIIPEFHTFKEAINSIYYDCLSIQGGKVRRQTHLGPYIFYRFVYTSTIKTLSFLMI